VTEEPREDDPAEDNSGVEELEDLAAALKARKLLIALCVTATTDEV
jgi:hypothetical protein